MSKFGRYKKNRIHKASKRGIKRRQKSRSSNKNKQGGMPVPEWVSIINYRTMDDAKKRCAVESGCHSCQTEWMREEINEFYEAISNEDHHEIEDEAMGLIRTYQQFRDCFGVVELWKQVRNDVLQVFPSRNLFEAAFDKWHKKKLLKNQAIGVVVQDLIDASGFSWI